MMGFEWIAKWYRSHRNPCDRCLVTTMCEKRYQCELYNNFHKRYNRIDNLSDAFDTAVICGCIIVVILFMIITFLLGFWKWYDILKPIAINLFN